MAVDFDSVRITLDTGREHDRKALLLYSWLIQFDDPDDAEAIRRHIAGGEAHERAMLGGRSRAELEADLSDSVYAVAKCPNRGRIPHRCRLGADFALCGDELARLQSVIERAFGVELAIELAEGDAFGYLANAVCGALARKAAS